MMRILKAKEAPVDTEADQGYSSARTSPNLTPCTSPQYPISPASSTCSSSSRSYLNVDSSYRQHPVPRTDYSVLDLNNPNVPIQDYYQLPPTDMTCQRVDNPADYRYFRSSRLLEASLNTVQPSTSMAVKRGLDTNVEIDRKRYRLTTQRSQVVL